MGTIGSGSDNLSSLLGYFTGTVAPIKGLIPEIGVQAIGAQSEWISKSDQERARDIFALMPPPPMMSIAMFQTIALHFPDHFSISRLSSTGNGWQSFGTTETAITLAAAFEWAKSQHLNSDLVKMLLTGVQKNPLEIALLQFVSQSSIGAVDIMQSQLLLRNIPVLTAVIRTAEPSLVLRAFTLAQEQLVLSMLDKWLEQEAELAKLQKESDLLREMDLQRIAMKILQAFVEKTTLSHAPISQPILSMLIGSLLTSNVSIKAGSLASPFIAAFSGATISPPFLENVPNSLIAELGSLSLGLISATTTWATPMAMALCSATGSYGQQAAYDISKSYAMTLCSFLMDPSLEAFVFSRLEEAKGRGLIDESKMNLLMAAFRDSLLINALALLYKAETGGVTGKELLAIIDGTMQIPEDNFLHTLAVLIKDSLKTLPKEEAMTLLKDLLTRYDEQLQIESLVEPTTSFTSLWDKDLSPMTFNVNPA